MKTGDIILIPFPFAELSDIKVRPAVIIGLTKDNYNDIIVSAISSVIPEKLSSVEIILYPDNLNNLRTISVLKTDRIATLKRDSVITILGKLNQKEYEQFKIFFQKLIED